MIWYLVAAAAGAVVAVLIVRDTYELLTKAQLDDYVQSNSALRECCFRLTAENAKLRVSINAGCFTIEGNNVAAHTLVALEYAIRNQLSPRAEAIMEALTKAEDEKANQQALPAISSGESETPVQAQ